MTSMTLSRAALVLIAVAVCGIVRGSSGQAVPSAHWARGSVIAMWIDAARAPSDGTRLVERAMRTWSDAADRRFTLTPAPARDGAAIRVRFVPSDANYGETLPRIDARTGAIVGAEVNINSDVAGDVVVRQIVVYLTALHELGHALGLPHTDDFGDIMYRFRRPDDGERYFGAYRRKLRSVADIGSASATGLSPGDVHVLRQLYDR